MSLIFSKGSSPSIKTTAWASALPVIPASSFSTPRVVLPRPPPISRVIPPRPVPPRQVETISRGLVDIFVPSTVVTHHGAVVELPTPGSDGIRKTVSCVHGGVVIRGPFEDGTQEYRCSAFGGTTLRLISVGGKWLIQK